MVGAEDIKELQKEIVADLTVSLKNDTNFDADALAIKVKGAILDVAMRREYDASSYSNEKIVEDLRKYYNTISRLAEYDYNQIGAEGQKSHSENETDRVWIERDEILKGVSSFVRFLK